MVYINDSWSGLIILIISYSYIVVAIKDIHTRYDTSIVCIPLPRGPSGNHSSRGPFDSVPWRNPWVLENRPCRYSTSRIFMTSIRLLVYVVIFKYAYVYVTYDTWSFYWLDNVPSHSNLDHCIIWWSGDLILYQPINHTIIIDYFLVYGRDSFP